MLFIIVIGALLFSYFMALTQVPNAITDWVGALGVQLWVVILMMAALYVVLSFFLDAISMILITVPVFLPLTETVGYGGIWFGIVVLVALEVGMITPPVGLNILVIRAQLPDIALGNVYRSIVPFLATHFGLMALLLLMPSLALWIPAWLY